MLNSCYFYVTVEAVETVEAVGENIIKEGGDAAEALVANSAETGGQLGEFTKHLYFDVTLAFFGKDHQNQLTSLLFHLVNAVATHLTNDVDEAAKLVTGLSKIEN